MSPLRIFHLIHHLRVGGAERLLVDLLPLLAKEGLEVHIGCLDDRGPLFEVMRERGIPAHFIGRHRGLDLAAVWRLQRLLRDLKIDLLNTHCFSAGLWGRLAALAARTPRVVATVHSVAGWQQPVKQYVCNRLLRPGTDRFVAVSGSVRVSLATQGTSPSRIRVIHNGIHAKDFAPAVDRVEACRRLGLPHDRFLIGWVGRCSAEKGGDEWIRALSLMDIEQHGVHGVLVGDGPELPRWKSLANHLGATHCVTFAGERLDVPAWLGALDVLVCPSMQESFGIAALEAQAAGVPVVATRVDGFLEVLHDGEDALLVPAGDVGALFSAIRTLRRFPELADRFRAVGRLNVAHFTIERTAEQYSALYRELLLGA